MPYCTECGAEVHVGVKFCPNCGAPILIKSGVKRPSAAPPARASKAEAKPEEIRAAPRAEKVTPEAPPRSEIPEGRAKAKRTKLFFDRKILNVAVIGIVVIAAVISFVLVSGGGPGLSTTTTQTTTTSLALGVLEGATNYVGDYPEAAMVSYTEIDGTPISVLAYPGQVQVFFYSTTPQQYAEDSIRANGGDIIGAIPLAGYYLVQVDIGDESAFILAILTDEQVIGSMPNLALAQEDGEPYISEDYLTTSKPVPLNVHGPVAIDSGWHGGEVARTAQANGGTITDIVNITGMDGMIASDKWKFALNAISQGNAIYNPGETTFINISQGAGYRDDDVSGDTNGNGELGDWSDWANLPADLQQQALINRTVFMADVLRGVQGLPPDLFDSTYITMSGGNNNMPLEPVLSILRQDSSWDYILQNNIAIATCPTSLYNQANQAPPGDPSVVVMTNTQAAGGTSYAAPAANAAVQHLTVEDILNIQNATGATFAQVTKAADMAKATNANHQVLPSEVQDKANIIVTAGTDPTDAYSVASISFTSVGGITSAVISPAIQGVTVQYTVSGTDGYYDSSSLQTDASGQVSFNIPAGASGVTDTISVSAVLSGRIATRTYKW